MLGNIFKVAVVAGIGAIASGGFSVMAEDLKLTAQGMDVEVQFVTPSIVRVHKTLAGKPTKRESLVVRKRGDGSIGKVSHNPGEMKIASDLLTVKVNPETGGVDFFNAAGEHLLKDKDYGTAFVAPNKVEQAFLLEPEEPIYGVGQVMDHKFNRRGSTHHMQNENMFTYSPYFMSPTKGYAVYWDNYSISDFSDSPQGLNFRGLGDDSDYYFIYGGTPDEIIAGVRELTGKAPMLPLWAYGFFQSKERYTTQQEHLDVLKKYRKLGVPIDCVIQDWRYWPEYNHTDSLWNSHSFDPERYPDPKKWADDIHRLNGKLMIVAWPGFGPKTEQRKELDSKGMIINFDTWPPESGARPYDVFNPEARDIYWKYLNNGIFSYIGNDGWWLDSTEPDHINRRDRDYDLPTALGPYRTVKNAYSLMHNTGIAEHQKAQNRDKRVVILTRSGFVGQQRLGSNTWSGDVVSTWDAFESQIPAALNFTIMGIPNWNSDIGGFFAGRWNPQGAKNPEYQELYTRWMQFGAFCPMMRSHGTEVPREIWQFGERGDSCFDAQEKMIRLRYSLLPYIYSTSHDVSANDGTFMRPLLMDFVADKNTHEIGNQYLFGKSIMVSPVTRPGVKSWSVYLPEGKRWWDFWDETSHEGGVSLDRAVTFDMLPLYVPAGSIIPFGPDVQWSTQKPWDDLEIRVYPGADGEFTLYEDEFDNYNYENGAYSTITFRWDDKNRKLTIGEREGSYPGMLKKRNFRVRIVGEDAPAKKVGYTGKRKVINN
ncbi:MAG: DUF5110 domain-containing protein [Muribaculaceae bacterium]|nr:DUF5110 domain-containing protein [Muribaculaceae bacterium]